MDEPRFPSWQELLLTVPTPRVDEALGRLATLGYESCWVEQPIENIKGPDGWQPVLRDPLLVKIHVYCDPDTEGEVERLFEGMGELVTAVANQQLATEDWIGQWRDGREIVELGGGWSICPPWLAEQAPDRTRALIIDPGLAFGVGDHPTTRDCSQLLLDWLQPGDRVLDLGAGSGVLSLLARMAGADSAVAVEIDALAAGEIGRNAALNGIDGVTVCESDAVSTPLDGPFDLILANIGAAELRRLAPRCTELAALGGRLILSGLVEWAADEVAACYAACGWVTQARIQHDSEWVTLGLRQP